MAGLSGVSSGFLNPMRCRMLNGHDFILIRLLIDNARLFVAGFGDQLVYFFVDTQAAVMLFDVGKSIAGSLVFMFFEIEFADIKIMFGN